MESYGQLRAGKPALDSFPCQFGLLGMRDFVYQSEIYYMIDIRSVGAGEMYYVFPACSAYHMPSKNHPAMIALRVLHLNTGSNPSRQCTVNLLSRL